MAEADEVYKYLFLITLDQIALTEEWLQRAELQCHVYTFNDQFLRRGGICRGIRT